MVTRRRFVLPFIGIVLAALAGCAADETCGPCAAALDIRVDKEKGFAPGPYAFDVSTSLVRLTAKCNLPEASCDLVPDGETNGNGYWGSAALREGVLLLGGLNFSTEVGDRPASWVKLRVSHRGATVVASEFSAPYANLDGPDCPGCYYAHTIIKVD